MSHYRPQVITGEVRVRSVQHLTDHIQRVTVSGPMLQSYSVDRPAEAFRVMRPPTGSTTVDFHTVGADGLPRWAPDQQRPSLRAYTVRSVPDATSISFDVVGRSDNAWPTRLAPDDLLGLAGVRHGYAAAPAAATHILVGDRSSLPAISAIIEALPDTARGVVIARVPHDSERQLLPPHRGMQVVWLDEPDPDPDHLADALRSTLRHHHPDHLYAAGEVSEVAAAHAEATTAGLPAHHFQPVAYWEYGISTDDRDPIIFRRYLQAANNGRSVSDPRLIAELDLRPTRPTAP